MSILSLVKAIENGTRRATSLVDELLDVSNLGTGDKFKPTLNLKTTDLVDLVRQVVTEQQLGTSTHKLEFQSTLRSFTGVWDNARLDRLTQNLIANAIKYSPEGGNVEITLDRQEVEGRPWAVLTVRDNGIGIPEQDVERIFERFARSGNVAGIQGAGIGLAYVREVAARHGGMVSVESRQGMGSTFIVRLPVDSV